MPPENRLLIQVVPRLKPAQCGVSDQAILLAQELKNEFGIDTAFVVLNSDEKCNLPYPMIHCRPDGLPDACLSLGRNQPRTVLVHVSGYGYSADGAPTLLAEAITKLKMDGRYRIAAFFHEIYATGKPWRSAFWHSRRQRQAIRRIAGECDLLVTSTGYHECRLQEELAGQSNVRVKLLPVFSAVGETRTPSPVALRTAAMVVFGLKATRQMAYKELGLLGGMLSTLGITEIIDIGPEIDVPPKIGAIPVRRKGPLAAQDLTGQLSQTMFGFLPYGPLHLAKSSILASYCAHGTIPVIARPFEGEIDGLTDGVQVISSRTAEVAKASGLQSISTAAWLWYSQHNLRSHASTYAEWIA